MGVEHMALMIPILVGPAAKIRGVAQQKTLQCARRIRQLSNLFAAHFPGGTRIHEQAAIGVACHRQSPVAVGRQRVSVPAWHRDAALAVKRELRSSLEHGVRGQLIAKRSLTSPLSPTF